MRKASYKLLSRLQISRNRNHAKLPRVSASEFHGFPSSQPEPHLKSSSKNPSFSVSYMNQTRFLTNPYQSLSTLVDPLAENAHQMSSSQKKSSKKSELKEAFRSAESLDEMIKAFEEMESCFDEKDLGLACLKIGLGLDREGQNPQKALNFGQRALRILGDSEVGDNDSSNILSKSLPVAMNLQLLGSSCFKLKMFNEGLGYLNRANTVLYKLDLENTSLPVAKTLHLLGRSYFIMNKFNESLGYLNRASTVLYKLELENSSSAGDVLPILHALHDVQLELFKVKIRMGRGQDALVHLMKAFEIKVKNSEEGSGELGQVNRCVAETYVAVRNFKEALSFGLKALEIHKMLLGQNSAEVARDRKLLGDIYIGLEEHEKALEQNQLAQKVLKKLGRDSDLLRAEIEAADMLISLGKYEEAINTLKGVVQQTDQESDERAVIFTYMGKAFCNLDKFEDGKRCLEIACGIIDKKDITSPIVVSCSEEIATQYVAMHEFGTALSLLKRSLSMLEKLPHQTHSIGTVSQKIGWLLLQTGKVEQSIQYLEDAAERLKASFGSNNYEVGYVYHVLGAAYLKLERPQSAAQALAVAKEIMDVALSPHHINSIEVCQNLTKAYAAMGRYPLALKVQEKVVEALQGHGPGAEEKLAEAVEVMEILKTIVAETRTSALSEEDEISAEDSPSGLSTTER